ncbi:hypothetical protein R6Z07F_009952 [Ovis aries]
MGLRESTRQYRRAKPERRMKQGVQKECRMKRQQPAVHQEQAGWAEDQLEVCLGSLLSRQSRNAGIWLKGAPSLLGRWKETASFPGDFADAKLPLQPVQVAEMLRVTKSPKGQRARNALEISCLVTVLPTAVPNRYYMSATGKLFPKEV